MGSHPLGESSSGGDVLRGVVLQGVVLRGSRPPGETSSGGVVLRGSRPAGSCQVGVVPGGVVLRGSCPRTILYTPKQTNYNAINLAYKGNMIMKFSETDGQN